MHAMRWIKGWLRTAALAAAGLLSDSTAADASRDAADRDEQEPRGEAREGQLPAGRVVRSPEQRVLDCGRLAALVDVWGEVEPALAAVLLGTALCTAQPIARMQVVCEWATCPSVLRRRALARALAHPFMCPGVPTAIEALAADPDARVRTAAMQAALLRLGHDPGRYGALLDSGRRGNVRSA